MLLPNDQFINSNNNIYAELLLLSKQYCDRLFQNIDEFSKIMLFLIMIICRDFFFLPIKQGGLVN